MNPNGIGVWVDRIKYVACLLFVSAFAIGCGRSGAGDVIQLSNDCVLEVKAEGDWEYQQALYYRIKKRDKQIVPWTYFGVAVNGERLFKVESRTSVVGFVQISDLRRVVILFDINSEEGWPGGHSNEQAAEIRERGNKMLKILNENFTFEIDS